LKNLTVCSESGQPDGRSGIRKGQRRVKGRKRLKKRRILVAGVGVRGVAERSIGGGVQEKGGGGGGP